MTISVRVMESQMEKRLEHELDARRIYGAYLDRILSGRKETAWADGAYSVIAT